MNGKNYCAVEKLKDGSEVVIRAVRAEDKDGFARGFEQLSGEAIYRRFFSARNNLPKKN